MSKKELKNVRTGPQKFVRFFKIGFRIFAVADLLALMVTLALAVGLKGTDRVVNGCLAGVFAAAFFAAYGYYALSVSMGTVLSADVTDKVVYLTTNRKVFTYDVRRGCVGVKAGRNRYVCTFETQNSRDKFIFYTRAPFSSYSDSQFSEQDIRRFCPRFDEWME